MLRSLMLQSTDSQLQKSTDPSALARTTHRQQSRWVCIFSARLIDKVFKSSRVVVSQVVCVAVLDA